MKKYFLEISSERKNIQKVEELMLNINKEFGLPEDEYNKMMIAVTEIAMNAIVHGNKESMLKKVKMYVEHDERTIKVMVFDEGDGFEISRLPDPTDMDNILDVHGRGVFIARAMVDEFYYRNEEGKGSEFVMIVNKK
ncbi:MAG: ATP-binding protein [Ignavibacteriales bacterium]|nr:ATP-binding protein [Ignavibacteriales bacterium]